MVKSMAKRRSSLWRINKTSQSIASLDHQLFWDLQAHLNFVTLHFLISSMSITKPVLCARPTLTVFTNGLECPWSRVRHTQYFPFHTCSSTYSCSSSLGLSATLIESIIGKIIKIPSTTKPHVITHAKLTRTKP